MMVVTIGVASLSSYAINYNSGSNDRSQAIAIAQREVERMRNARFTANVTDAVLAGGTQVTLNVTGANRRPYTVDVVVDDDPATAGIQTDTTKTLKSIMVTVTPRGAGPTWATNSVGSTVTIVTQRARLD